MTFILRSVEPAVSNETMAAGSVLQPVRVGPTQIISKNHTD
jgi:hypothetical protein